MALFEYLGLVDKCPCKIKQEMEELSEQNYREQTLKLHQEAREFKKKHKNIIEHRLNKPIEQVTIKELFLLGFDSSHLTRKYLEGLE